MADMHSFLATHILPIIAKNNSISICDYGCGTGTLLELLQKENPKLILTGIDYLSKYKNKNPQNREENNISYIDKDDDDYNKLVSSEKFDMIISTFSLHHFKYPVRELQTIYNLVKPNGILLFVDFGFINNTKAKFTKNISSFIDEMGQAVKGRYHRHHYTLDEALDLFNAIPVDTSDSFEVAKEISNGEMHDAVNSKIKRNLLIQKNLKEKAPDFWRDAWIPFFEQEKYLIEEYGTDYSDLFFIIAKNSK